MHLVDELPMGRTPPGVYTENHRNRARERILDKKIAYGLLVRADRNRYGKLIEEVENSFLKGNNDYPNTPPEAYNLLVNYKNFNLHKRGAPEEGLDQVAFMTEGKKLKPNGNFLHIKCYKCGKFGHYKSDCKEKKNQEKEGEAKTTEFCQVITVTALMTQAMWVQKKEEIDLLWIIFKIRGIVSHYCLILCLSDWIFPNRKTVDLNLVLRLFIIPVRRAQ